MRIEGMATWTVDQLKEELVRLADERETKQHEILDKNEKINGFRLNWIKCMAITMN